MTCIKLFNICIGKPNGEPGSIEMFRWHEHLAKMPCPNEQVKLLNEVLLNIYSHFIPNQVKTIKPRQAPWITNSVKTFLRKKIMPINRF